MKLHPIMLLRRTACVFSVSFSKLHFLTTYLSSVLAQSLTWVFVCQLCQHRDTLPESSFQAGLAAQLWGMQSAESLKLPAFSGSVSVTESHFTWGHALWGLSTFDDWVRPLGTAQDDSAKQYSIQSLSLLNPSLFFHRCQSSTNTLNSLSSSASRKPSLQSSFCSCQCPSAQPGPMTRMLPLDHVLQLDWILQPLILASIQDSQ